MLALFSEARIVAGENHLQDAAAGRWVLHDLRHPLLETVVRSTEVVRNHGAVASTSRYVVIGVIRIDNREAIWILVHERVDL